ncbi:hypothetical protein [Streptomyces sp. NBC_01445]|uniref:hypothetical protein n=1 Tax=Streptomyces sp. NBC_01445 TaxID=2903869 RepID=UPI002DD9686F|nr:hypothetical protein [Streptomyces sp. NBC_01445]WSE08905.1 hypothetical protein OG574_39375 [Streptomyces sp. NBC_01445]
MAETHPHITVGHHGRYGVVAATSHDNHVAEHILRLVGFERLPGSVLYSLTDPTREPLRRGAQAVQSMRAAQYSVTSDAAYDLQPYTRLSPSRGPTDLPEKPPIMPVSGIQEAAVASARPLDADIRADRIIVHDQVRDPEGILRAMGTETRTNEGVPLPGEGDLQYVETLQVRTDLAFDAFSYVRDSGWPDPVSTMQQRRAQAATALSPACTGVSPPRRPAVSVEYHPTPAAPEPSRTR